MKKKKHTFSVLVHIRLGIQSAYKSTNSEMVHLSSFLLGQGHEYL